MLEIGVQNGGSLELWSKYFKSGKKFVGCDCNEKLLNLSFKDPRIDIVVGDVNTLVIKNKIHKCSNSYDLIIDDGSHISSDIIKSFILYFPMLMDEGIYIIEDLHCSYWQEYEGGLFYPLSSVEFLKKLIDLINYEHWGVDKKITDHLESFTSLYGIEIKDDILEQIHSIEFINSLCVIKKKDKKFNKLSKRFIVGNDMQVEPSIYRFKNQYSKPLSQIKNSCSDLKSFPMGFKEKIEELASKDQELAALRNSFSWKITKFYRYLSRRIKLLINFLNVR